MSGFWTDFVVFLLPMCSVTQFPSTVDCFNLIPGVSCSPLIVLCS